jgi:iron complex outermembrane receptor protein
MRPVVWVSLCFSLVLAVRASGGSAATPDEVVETPDVVVSSTRLPDAPVDARLLPAKVTVITAADVQRTGAKTVQEAVQWATGIVMYDQRGNSFQQSIDLRGFNSQPVPGTAVFIDGMRANEPDFGDVNFDLIPFEMIDRIEIIPGASAIYGKNALGGVINIITKRGGDKRQVTGETLFGSFHRERYSLNTSGPIGKFDYFGNFTRETEDGFRDESDARISRFFGKLGYRPTADTDVTVSYTYVKDFLREAGSLPVSVAAIDRKRNFTPGDFTDNEQNILRVTGRQSLSWGFSVNFTGYYRRLGQQLFNVGQSSRSNNIVHTESRGGTVQLTQQSAPLGFRNTLVLGAEASRNDIGTRLDSTSGFGPFNNMKDNDESILAFFAQDTFNVTPQLAVTAGVRYDRNKLESSFSDSFSVPDRLSRVCHRTTPRAGVSYLVTPEASVYFNYSQGFRIPTTDELFALGTFTSNANLKPVVTNNYEVGTKVKFGSWGEGALSLYQSNTRNEIYFTCTLCDFSFGDGLNRNVDKSRRRGVEATVKARLNSYLDGVVNYTFTEAQFRAPFNLSSTLRADVGDTFPQVPKHRLSVTGNLHPADGWTVSLIGLYVSTQFHTNDEGNTQPRLPGYFLLNSRINYERPVPGGRLNGFLMMNNLLDQKYSTSGIIAANNLTGGGATERFVVTAPGIAIFGGLSYKFESF